MTDSGFVFSALVSSQRCFFFQALPPTLKTKARVEELGGGVRLRRAPLRGLKVVSKQLFSSSKLRC